MKNVGSLDVRKDLRVRGRVQENLRVRKEVEASAFYIRGVGELEVLSAAFAQPFYYAESTSNTEATVENLFIGSVKVPDNGVYRIKAHVNLPTNSGTLNNDTGGVFVSLEEKVGSGASIEVANGFTGGTTVLNSIVTYGPVVVDHTTPVVINGQVYTYKTVITLDSPGVLDAGVGRKHTFLVECLRVR